MLSEPIAISSKPEHQPELVVCLSIDAADVEQTGTVIASRATDSDHFIKSATDHYMRVRFVRIAPFPRLISEARSRT